MNFIYTLIFKLVLLPFKIIFFPLVFIWRSYKKRYQEVQIAIIYIALFGLGGVVAYFNFTQFGGYLLNWWETSPSNAFLWYLHGFLMLNVTFGFLAIGFLPYLFFERLMKNFNKYEDYWKDDNPDKK